MADPRAERHLQDPIGRFSSAAAAYHSSRPRPPAAIIDAALDGFDRSRCTIVDLGAGPGVSSVALAAALRGQSRVIAIEPNAEMRAHAQPDERIEWRPATAERTGLEGASADIVFAHTAFHWFAPEEAAREILRILRPRGRLALSETDCREDDPLAREFHRLMGEPDSVRSFGPPAQRFASAFPRAAYTAIREFEAFIDQSFDLPALLQRAESSSYMPRDQMQRLRAKSEIAAFFDRCADHRGLLTLRYRTVAAIAEKVER